MDTVVNILLVVAICGVLFVILIYLLARRSPEVEKAIKLRKQVRRTLAEDEEIRAKIARTLGSAMQVLRDCQNKITDAGNEQIAIELKNVMGKVSEVEEKLKSAVYGRESDYTGENIDPQHLDFLSGFEKRINAFCQNILDTANEIYKFMNAGGYNKVSELVMKIEKTCLDVSQMFVKRQDILRGIHDR